MADSLPLFPLGTVLLPGVSLPLHVFEPRYRQLITDLVTGTVPEKRFGMVAIRQGWQMGEDNIEGMELIGCSALLRKVRTLPDGRFDITVCGERRFKLLDVDCTAAPYLVASVDWEPDSTPTGVLADLLPALARSAQHAHDRYQEQAHTDRLRGTVDEEVDGGLAYTLAAGCLLSLEDRQRLLECNCPASRLRLLRRILALETELLRELRAVPLPLAEFAEDFTRN
ncbi:peptidase [Pseudonocardiaceae bacterium YIM PH 21723]|nr:peptidase [Pseudonocardiaceae bacterium YIM PH 21723]